MNSDEAWTTSTRVDDLKVEHFPKSIVAEHLCLSTRIAN